MLIDKETMSEIPEFRKVQLRRSTVSSTSAPAALREVPAATNPDRKEFFGVTLRSVAGGSGKEPSKTTLPPTLTKDSAALVIHVSAPTDFAMEQLESDMRRITFRKSSSANALFQDKTTPPHPREDFAELDDDDNEPFLLPARFRIVSPVMDFEDENALFTPRKTSF